MLSRVRQTVPSSMNPILIVTQCARKTLSVSDAPLTEPSRRSRFRQPTSRQRKSQTSAPSTNPYRFSMKSRKPSNQPNHRITVRQPRLNVRTLSVYNVLNCVRVTRVESSRVRDQREEASFGLNNTIGLRCRRTRNLRLATEGCAQPLHTVRWGGIG